MKYFIVISLALLFISITKITKEKKYTINEFYKATNLEFGCKVISSKDYIIDDIKTLLTPAKYEYGTFEVQLTSKWSDYYLIEGTNWYLRIPNCVESGYALKAKMNITIGSYNAGTVFFQ